MPSSSLDILRPLGAILENTRNDENTSEYLVFLEQTQRFPPLLAQIVHSHKAPGNTKRSSALETGSQEIDLRAAPSMQRWNSRSASIVGSGLANELQEVCEAGK